MASHVKGLPIRIDRFVLNASINGSTTMKEQSTNVGANRTCPALQMLDDPLLMYSVIDVAPYPSADRSHSHAASLCYVLRVDHISSSPRLSSPVHEASAQSPPSQSCWARYTVPEGSRSRLFQTITAGVRKDRSLVSSSHVRFSQEPPISAFR
jgi:hypothetical protein